MKLSIPNEDCIFLSKVFGFFSYFLGMLFVGLNNIPLAIILSGIMPFICLSFYIISFNSASNGNFNLFSIYLWKKKEKTNWRKILEDEKC